MRKSQLLGWFLLLSKSASVLLGVPCGRLLLNMQRTRYRNSNKQYVVGFRTGSLFQGFLSQIFNPPLTFLVYWELMQYVHLPVLVRQGFLALLQLLQQGAIAWLLRQTL